MEISACKEAMEPGWLGPGSYVKKFEESVSELLEINKEKVIAVNTGTSAVHMALSLFDLKPGDEVITPSLIISEIFKVLSILGQNLFL